jgi:ribonuclease HI
MILYTDGGYKPKTGAYGSGRLENDDGSLAKMMRWEFPYPVNTNNEAEYATLLESLMWCEHAKVKELEIFCDSQLMVRQLQRVYKINKPELLAFAEKIWECFEDFDKITITHVPREVLVDKVGH